METRRELRAQAPAHHRLDQRIAIERREAATASGREAPVDAVHQFAVAQHGDPVGDRLDLLQSVADVDRGSPATREFAHLAQQSASLARRQRRGRLVQNQQPGPLRQRLRDLHRLPRAERQPGTGGGRVDVDLQQSEQPARLALFPASADEASPGPAGAEKEILAHTQLRDQTEFLVDHRDPPPARLRR